MNYLTDINSTVMLVGVIGAAIALSIGVYYLVNEKKFDQLRAWAGIVVNSLEQSMKLVEGSRKYELAMVALRSIRDGLHSKATDVELGLLIDGAVHVMKNVAEATPGTADDELVGALTSGLTPSKPE
jgi:hypothetical protein